MPRAEGASPPTPILNTAMPRAEGAMPPNPRASIKNAPCRGGDAPQPPSLIQQCPVPDLFAPCLNKKIYFIYTFTSIVFHGGWGAEPPGQSPLYNKHILVVTTVYQLVRRVMV